MEMKTNKAKLKIFKFLRKLAESQGYSIAFDKISRNCAFYGNSINILTRVFSHAELISVMKTVKNNTVFMKT